MGIQERRHCGAGGVLRLREVHDGLDDRAVEDDQERVAAVIAHAAGSRAPKARYMVPASSRPLIALLTLLADKLADKAKLRVVS